MKTHCYSYPEALRSSLLENLLEGKYDTPHLYCSCIKCGSRYEFSWNDIKYKHSFNYNRKAKRFNSVSGTLYLECSDCGNMIILKEGELKIPKTDVNFEMSDKRKD